jgi:hypothetical protein
MIESAHMTRLQRRLIFYLFVMAFFIGAPTVVLYTAGYRLDTTDRVLTLRTGGLAISSLPKRAEISLDGQTHRQRTPFIFKQLNPKSYEVELKRNGFRSWNGKIEIEAGLTSYIQDILLFREAEPEFLQELSASEFSIDPTGRRLAYATEGAGWLEFWLLDLRNGRLENTGRVIADKIDVDIQWSIGGNYVAFKNNNQLKVFRKNGQAINLNSLPETIKNISWHPVNEELLLIQAERLTVEVSMLTQNLTELTNGTILQFNQNRAIVARDSQESTIISLQENDRLSQVAALPVNQYRVFAWQNPFLILQNGQGQLISVNLQAKSWQNVGARVSDSDWQEKQLALVFTDGNEIAIYRPGQTSVELLTRLSNRINGVAWHPAQSRIIYADESKIYALDAFRFTERRNLLELAEFDRLSRFWLSSDGKDLYAVAEKNGANGLFKLRLQ